MNTGNIGYLREKFLNFDRILDLNLTLQFEIALFRLIFVEIRQKVAGFCLLKISRIYARFAKKGLFTTHSIAISKKIKAENPITAR